MTAPDTPDDLKPAPGGSATLLNTHPNLAAAGGHYASPWFDVTSFSGLLVEFQMNGAAADFGSFNVTFRNAGANGIINPTYFGTWRADLQAAFNVPVLGTQAQVTIDGAARNINADMTVTGHGGGPGTQIGLASGVMAKIQTGSLGAGLGTSQIVQTIREGAAQLHLETGTQPGNISVTAFDSNGVGTNVGGFTVTAGQNDTKRIWVPPMPVQLNLANTGAGAGAFNAFLVAERS